MMIGAIEQAHDPGMPAVVRFQQGVGIQNFCGPFSFHLKSPVVESRNAFICMKDNDKLIKTNRLLQLIE
jgi:hypothetical protein